MLLDLLGKPEVRPVRRRMDARIVGSCLSKMLVAIFLQYGAPTMAVHSKRITFGAVSPSTGGFSVINSSIIDIRAGSDFFAIPHKGGIKSPADAVRATIVADHPEKARVRMRNSYFIATLLAFSTATAYAGTEECNTAIESYNSAASGIATALRRYSSCVSGSQGHDACSSEFRRVRSAQSDFESAVADYESNCP